MNPHGRYKPQVYPIPRRSAKDTSTSLWRACAAVVSFWRKLRPVEGIFEETIRPLPWGLTDLTRQLADFICIKTFQHVSIPLKTWREQCPLWFPSHQKHWDHTMQRDAACHLFVAIYSISCMTFLDEPSRAIYFLVIPQLQLAIRYLRFF